MTYQAIKKFINKKVKKSYTFQKQCLSCESFERPLNSREIEKFLVEIKNWEVVENRKIKRDFKFNNFKETMIFGNKIAKLAEREQHHPNIYIFYNHLKVELSTHSIGGLSENDFIMAAKIDKIYNDQIKK